MVTYGDYFSRKMLYRCGISPDKALLSREENAYTGTQRQENIRSKMSEIYQTLYCGYADNNTSAKNENFDDFQIERKIVSAFYDSGILSNAERDYFQTQEFQKASDREQICVEEASMAEDKNVVQNTYVQEKTPLTRTV